MWKVWLEMGGRLEMQIAPVSTTTFVFSPKTHFTFYLLSSWMRRWAISAAIYLSREEEASINTIINIKLRVVRGRFSIIFLKSYINFFSGYYILAQIIGAACFKWIIESFMDLVSFHSLGSGDAMKFVYAKSKMSNICY